MLSTPRTETITLSGVTHPPGPANSGHTPLPPTPDTSGQQPFHLDQMAGPRKRKLWPWIIAALAAALVAASVGAFLLRSKPDPLQIGYDACAAAVLAELKAPSTAEFGGGSWHPDVYPPEIHGWVDAENSFGAKLRSNVECSVERTGDNWRILDAREKPR